MAGTAQFNGEVGNIESNINKVDSFDESISDDAAKQKYPSIKCLKKIPRIIESGTSGIWDYRKWSDGTVECWGNYTASGINVAENNYSGYYYSRSIEVPLPCSFLSIKDYQVNGGSMDRINFAKVFGATNSAVWFVICGHQSDATDVDISVYLSVKGRWK